MVTCMLHVCPAAFLDNCGFSLTCRNGKSQKEYTSARVASSDRVIDCFLDGNRGCLRGWRDCMIGDIVVRCDINGSGNSTGLLIRRLKVAFGLLCLLGLGTA